MIQIKQNPLQIFILLLVVFLAMSDKSSSSHSTNVKASDSDHALTYSMDELASKELQHAATTSTHAKEAFRDCSDCPEMMSMPGGTFMMGAADDQKYA